MHIPRPSLYDDPIPSGSTAVRVRLLIFIVLIISILIIGIMVLDIPRPSLDNNPISSGSTAVSIEERYPPKGWKEYKSIIYNFSLFYPENLLVNEYSEGGGAVTMTFQNINEQKGFQIFIIPYNESQVSEERFKKDIPSGVRSDLTDIVIDNVTGATFFSKNVLLGDTKEIWFIHNGLLFEVTTLKSLDSWLIEIIQTWEFF